MNICVFGDGVMGNIVRQMILEGEDCVVNEDGMSPSGSGGDIYAEEIGDCGPVKIDGLIDFSYPGNINSVYECALGLYEESNPVPVVIATTGYNEEQLSIIKKIAEFSPVMLSSNYSYGINCMAGLVESAIRMAGDADVEIIEKHHNRKLDVPSGTALMLAKLTGRPILCGRSTPGKRGKEVAIHSIRGGNIFGEHTVIIAMADEVIEIKHTAYSRRIFAGGAIEAVHWLEGKPAGMYNILDCLNGLC